MHHFLQAHLWAIAPDSVPALSAMAADIRSAGPESLSLFEPPAEAKPYETVGGVAVIPLRGSMIKRARFAWPGIASMEQVRTNIALALEDRDVSAVLLDVDSPGGTVAGTKELADFVSAARREKPFAAYADGLMCSAAYWVGSATGRIFAPHTATVGSIGVLQLHVEFGRWLEKAGVTYTYLHAGEFKTIGNPVQPLSERDRAYIQSRLDSLYAMFVHSVAANMDLDPADADSWADGHTFLADDARKLGLITEIGTREQALRKLTEETGPMDVTTLKTNHPETYQAILAEGRSAAEADGGEATAKAVEAERERVIGITAAVLGEETTARIRPAVEADLTADQARALAESFAAPAGPESDEDRADEESRRQILAGLHATSPAPVATKPGTGIPTPEEEAAATIDRLAGIART